MTSSCFLPMFVELPQIQGLSHLSSLPCRLLCPPPFCAYHLEPENKSAKAHSMGLDAKVSRQVELGQALRVELGKDLTT